MKAQETQYNAKNAILNQALSHVPFDGWTPQLLNNAAREAGYEEGYAEILFPHGVADLVAFFIEEADNAMLETLKSLNLNEMRVRDRIATAIKTRITYHAAHKGAIAPTLRFFAQPQNASQGTKALAHTCSEIWYAAGDNATDYNYYSKRTLLAGVYSSTLLYWLDDDSEDNQNTWEFLDRRISNVLKIGGLPKKIAGYFSGVKEMFPFCRGAT